RASSSGPSTNVHHGEHMKQFLAIFIGSSGSMAKWNELPEAERQQRQAKGIAAWRKWVDDHKADIAQMGGPLGKTKKVSSSGIADIRNNMSAWTVVSADSQQDAAKLFENH